MSKTFTDRQTNRHTVEIIKVTDLTCTCTSKIMMQTSKQANTQALGQPLGRRTRPRPRGEGGGVLQVSCFVTSKCFFYMHDLLLPHVAELE